MPNTHAPIGQAALERGYTPPTQITKEIAKDVYLIKELIQVPTSTAIGLQSTNSNQASGEAASFYFVFRLANDSLKDMDFEADFTGSENVTLSTDKAWADQHSNMAAAAGQGVAGAGGGSLQTASKRP